MALCVCTSACLNCHRYVIFQIIIVLLSLCHFLSKKLVFLFQFDNLFRPVIFLEFKQLSLSVFEPVFWFIPLSFRLFYVLIYDLLSRLLLLYFSHLAGTFLFQLFNHCFLLLNDIFLFFEHCFHLSDLIL
jgi:hypothetical protein